MSRGLGDVYKRQDQARAYGRVLPPLLGAHTWRLVSSPLARCMQTMAILCETAGLDFAAVSHDAHLKEVSTGSYSGRLKAEFPPGELGGRGRQAWFFRCPGGESHDHLRARLTAWLTSLDGDGHVIAVSHGVAGRVLRGLYAGWDPDFALEQDSPQNALFVLHDGRVDRHECAVAGP